MITDVTYNERGGSYDKAGIDFGNCRSSYGSYRCNHGTRQGRLTTAVTYNEREVHMTKQVLTSVIAAALTGAIGVITALGKGD